MEKSRRPEEGSLRTKWREAVSEDLAEKGVLNWKKIAKDKKNINVSQNNKPKRPVNTSIYIYK